MNFFSSPPAAPTGTSALTAAKTDVEIMRELYSKMSKTCSKKCVTKYNDAELAVGELTCIDRCTGKYMHGHAVIGEVVKAFDNQLKAQREATQTP